MKWITSTSFDDDTLMPVDANPSRPPAPLLRARDAAAPRRGAPRARGALQGARRPDAGRARQPARRRGRGLRLRPERGLRALAADDLTSPADPARGRPRRGEPSRDVGLLPARARGDRLAAGSARRM